MNCVNANHDIAVWLADTTDRRQENGSKEHDHSIARTRVGGMLSAFKAQPIHELKPGDKSKIESLLTYGDRLLVGLNNGALRIYRVIEASQSEGPVLNGDSSPASPSKKAKLVELLREEDKFSKRPVQQLAIIKEANLLISLSDGYIYSHDLQTYQLVERLENTKGATCFTLTSNVVKDVDTGVPALVSRLAVGVKRKVLCWTWHDMEQLPNVTEITLETSIKSLIWISGTKLMAGMDAGFSLVDIRTQEIRPINKAASRSNGETGSAEVGGVRFGAVSSSGMGYMGMGSWVPKPMATGLSENQVLLAKDVNTLFTDSEGRPLEKRQVPWSLAPEAIGYSYPYLLALHPPERGILQIRNPDTLSLLQTISVPNATLLHVPPPNISLAHAGKRFLVASDRVIWRMNALPYDDQLGELVLGRRFDEAVSLLSLLEDTLIDNKLGRIREIKIQKAISLFEERKYRDSLDLFTEAEAPPERVIKLFPREISGDLAKALEDAVPDAANHAIEDSEAKIESAIKEPPSTPSKGLLGRVTGARPRKGSDAESVQSSTRVEIGTPSSHKRSSSKQIPDKALEGEDLKQAVRCLTSFLAQARVKIQKYLDPDGFLKDIPPSLDHETGKPEFADLLPETAISGPAQEIDWQAELFKTAQLVYTTLFRSYMLVSPSLAGSLFRIDNFCDPDVVQSSLYENHRYNDLIDFLHGKKLHRQALEMLVKFGKGQAQGEIPDGMQGPERTVAYLKQLPPELIELILEFAAWPVRENPDVGMDVFLADTDNAERLPKQQVLRFLASIDMQFEVKYLEHIINELGDETAEFHQQLVDSYLQGLKSDDLVEAERIAFKDKLESFIQRSKQYNKAKTFRQLPADEPIFFETRAIVLSAMGNHKQALTIYVFQLHDYEKAESYCNKTYQNEETERADRPANSDSIIGKPSLNRSVTEVSKDKPNIYAILLGLYLDPPTGDEKRWTQALDLLSRHGARLPASSTLKLMPNDLPVKELHDYFRGRLRHATSLWRQEKVIRSLEGVRSANTEYLLRFGTEVDVETSQPGGMNRRVRIGEDDRCRVCHKRFGASTVRVFPDNDVVHYGCVGKKAQEMNSTGGGTGWR